MAFFDAVVRDVADRFGPGAKAGALVNEIVRGIINEPGGLAGYLDRFTVAGLGELTQSWIGSGQNAELSVTQLRRALGAAAIARIAAKVGLTPERAAPAMAFAVPQIVDLLTPHGRVPESLPAAVTHATGGGAAAGVRTPATTGLSRRSWLWPLLILLPMLIGWWAYSQTAGDRPARAPAPPSATAQPAPHHEARLALAYTGGTLRYDGVVGDDRTKRGILDAMTALFGAGAIQGDIRIDPQAAAAPWLDKLSAVLVQIREQGAEVLLEGKTISVGGVPVEADLQALIERLRGVFGPDFRVGTYSDRLLAAIAAAREQTLAAVKGLRTAFRSEELITLLNLSIIHFEPGSAVVGVEDRRMLESVAAAIRSAPKGTRVEIGGHTDSTGDAAGNLALSQARAEAVRDVLVEHGVDPARLVAKGYGATQPIADNGTEFGRFKNRRISYSLLPPGS